MGFVVSFILIVIGMVPQIPETIEQPKPLGGKGIRTFYPECRIAAFTENREVFGIFHYFPEGK